MRANTLLSDLLSRVTEAERALTAAEAGRASLADRCAALLGGRGEATGLALARSILGRFAALDAAGRRAYLAEIKDRFGVDEAAFGAAVAAWRAGDGDAARRLHFASEPRTQTVIRLLNRPPGGTATVVAMRAALLESIEADPSLRPLDDDFRHLLVSWFNRGFLELRRIDWSTSAEILEKIIAHEAVHAIHGWDDLRRRVAAPDRRLHALFDPALRGERLIFVGVALLHAVSRAIGPILAEAREPLDPRAATTTVFYSISNGQPGLRGVSSGNFLIKRVVEELRVERSTLRTFVALSPMPGLRRWAEAEARREGGGALTRVQREAVLAAEGGAPSSRATWPRSPHPTSWGPRARAARRSTRWRATTSATALGSSGSIQAATRARGGCATPGGCSSTTTATWARSSKTTRRSRAAARSSPRAPCDAA